MKHKEIKWLITLFQVWCVCSLTALGQQGVVSGVVSDNFGPLPGAEIAVQGTNYIMYTDLQGKYILNLEKGNYAVVVSFPLYEKVQYEVVVIPSEEVILDIQLKLISKEQEEISVGSKDKPRSLLSTAVPVDLISASDITSSSQLELSQILHYLSPSFHSVPQTISDGTDHIDPASFRGLGPDQLLILVNNKRRHTTSLVNVNGTVGRGSVGTDLNSIPVSAIDRIEILRDGAAAQYGSDAIAGVINIVLKEEVNQVNSGVTMGINHVGDGAEVKAFTNLGFEIGDEGFVNISGEFRKRGATNRAGDFTGNVYDLNDSLDRQLIMENDFWEETGYRNKRVMEIGNAATTNTSFYLNTEIPISAKAVFYANGGLNFRVGESHGFYRFPRELNKVVLSLYPNGFSPEIQTNIVDLSNTAGFLGTIKSWEFDFSNTVGLNSLGFNIKNSNNASLGASSPVSFYSGGFFYLQNTTHFEATRKFSWLEGVNIAFGAETRIENYQIRSGEEASWLNGEEMILVGQDTLFPDAGAQVFPGFRPENELNKFRTNTATFLDAEVNFTPEFLVGAAARAEVYSDFGSNLTAKLVGRYLINSKWSVRLGYNSGFRAPSLQQIYFNNIGVQFIDGEAQMIGTFNNESTVTKAFNIDPLKPELSHHFNIGTSSRILKELSLNIDGYYIAIRDRIVLSGRFGNGYESILTPLNTSAAQFFTNAINTRTLGVDVVARYTKEFYNKKLDVSIAANYTNTQMVGEVKVGEALVGEEAVLFNREEISRIEVAQPNFKICSKVKFDIDRWEFLIRNTVFGRVQYIHPADGDPANWVINELSGQVESRDQTFSPKAVTDIMASVMFWKKMKLTLGVNNLLNVYPDKHAHSSNISSGNFLYSRRVQQFGVRGTNYFMKMELTF